MRTLILAAVMAVMPAALSPLCYGQESTAKQASGDLEQMSASIKQLTSENEHLRMKIADLERRLKNQSIRDRMTQEEQRAENLEEQLF